MRPGTKRVTSVSSSCSRSSSGSSRLGLGLSPPRGWPGLRLLGVGRSPAGGEQASDSSGGPLLGPSGRPFVGLVVLVRAGRISLEVLVLDAHCRPQTGPALRRVARPLRLGRPEHGRRDDDLGGLLWLW